jgi:hypothetical protein
MTAINFPDTPEVGDTFSVGQITWEWTGSVWKGFTDTSANVTVSTTPPDDTGSIWFNSENGFTYIYYDSYWTSIASSSGSQIISDTAPTSPVVGMQWFNSSNGKSYLYYSNAWIEVDSNGNSASSGGNVIINGGMDIWQRGTSFSDVAFGYQADRWSAGRGGFTSGMSVSRQAGTSLAPTQYAARVQRASGNTSTANLRFGTTFESVNSIPLAGQTVTLSFYARAGANYSSTSSLLNVFLRTGVTIDAGNIVPADSFGASTVTVINQNAALTTSWQRFTYTGYIDPTATQIGIRFTNDPVGTAGANDWYEVTGVQLEAGTVATPFRRNAPSIQAELAACQRYYWRNGTTANSASYGQLLHGFQTATTQAAFMVHLPVPMRAYPTSLGWSGLEVSDEINYGSAPSSLSLSIYRSDFRSIAITAIISSAGAQFRACTLRRSFENNGFLEISAEL